MPFGSGRGKLRLDLDDAQSRLDGSEKMLLWCSPQNPSGRVWTPDELQAVAAFAERNGLILVSDEIHHDLVYPGAKFVPMDVAAPDARPWTVTLTAASKTFNIAGQRTGNMIIPDPKLRAAMKQRLQTLDYDPGALGVAMITAAYSPEGAEWVDAQIAHLEGNRRLFDQTITEIRGSVRCPCRRPIWPGSISRAPAWITLNLSAGCARTRGSRHRQARALALEEKRLNGSTSPRNGRGSRKLACG